MSGPKIEGADHGLVVVDDTSVGAEWRRNRARVIAPPHEEDDDELLAAVTKLNAGDDAEAEREAMIVKRAAAYAELLKNMIEFSHPLWVVDAVLLKALTDMLEDMQCETLDGDLLPAA